MTEAKTRARRFQVPGAVIKYLGSHIGLDVHIGDMARDLNFTEAQIRSAIYNLRNTNEILRRDIAVIISGQTWRYLPRPVEVPTDEGSNDHVAESTQLPARASESSDDAPTTSDDQLLSSTTRVLYERVGELNGETIVRDEMGQCYRIEPIKLQLDLM